MIKAKTYAVDIFWPTRFAHNFELKELPGTRSNVRLEVKVLMKALEDFIFSVETQKCPSVQEFLRASVFDCSRKPISQHPQKQTSEQLPSFATKIHSDSSRLIAKAQLINLFLIFMLNRLSLEVTKDLFTLSSSFCSLN